MLVVRLRSWLWIPDGYPWMYYVRVWQPMRTAGLLFWWGVHFDTRFDLLQNHHSEFRWVMIPPCAFDQHLTNKAQREAVSCQQDTKLSCPPAYITVRTACLATPPNALQIGSPNRPHATRKKRRTLLFIGEMWNRWRTVNESRSPDTSAVPNR